MSMAHWTWAVPSGPWLRTPLVVWAGSSAAVMTCWGAAPSEVEATRVRGTPTRAVWVRAVPATS